MGAIYHNGIFYGGGAVIDDASHTNQTTYSSNKIESRLAETQSIIGESYSAIKSYAVGERFIDGNIIYTVKVACKGVTPPNATYYTARRVVDEISALNSELVVTSGVQVSIPNGVATMTESLTLEKGIYIVVYTAQFDRNSTGIRVIGNNAIIPQGPRNGVVSQNAISSNTYTTMQMTKIINSNNSTTELYCYQNSGAALNVWTKIEAVKV